MSGLRSLALGGLGGAGGVLIARILLPDITYQEKTMDTRPDQVIPEAAPSTPESSPSLSSSAAAILKYGVPAPGLPTILEYENHVLEYDTVRRVPKWVAEHVSKTKAFGSTANRKLARFDRDPHIPPQFTADNKDFWGSGWSRGHMAPAGNNKHSQTAMNQTFYLSNIVPQDLDNNGNYWNRLEIYCRELTNQFSDVYIISGPLWLPEQESITDQTSKSEQIVKPEDSNVLKAAKETIIEKQLPLTNVNNQTLPTVKLSDSSDKNSGNDESKKKVAVKSASDTPPNPDRKFRPKPPKKFVKYQVLGNNNVAVPTHLFKIVLIEDPLLDRPLLASFIIPNRPIQDVHLRDFEVELAEVESHVGVRFHQQLDLGRVDKLCLKEGCEMRNYKVFQDFFWTRRLSTPWNLRNLEADWKEACSRGLNTPAMEQLYLTKKKEFIDKQAAKVENKSTKESWESPEKPLEKPSQEKPQEKPNQEKPQEKPNQEKANYAVEDEKQTEKAPAVAA